MTLDGAQKPPKTACHEAGHAIVALLLGIPLIRVEIWPSGRGGVCLIGEPPGVRGRLRSGDPGAVQWAEQYVVWLAAGHMSEMALLGSASLNGDSDDRRMIADLLADLYPPPEMTAPAAEWDLYQKGFEERRSRIYADAGALLATSAARQAVTALAIVLAESMTVSGAAAREIAAHHISLDTFSSAADHITKEAI